MSTHDIHPETTPEPRDERRCGHPHHDAHGEHGHRDASEHRDRRHGMRDERAPFGRGMHPRRAFGHPMGHGERGFGHGPFGPGSGPGRPDAAEDRSSRGERGSGHARQRRLDRRILRTARIVAVAEHRAGREAVERTMAASVSHADHEATMRTLRSIARAVRAEHLPGRRHGGEQHGGEQPQR